MPETSDNTEIMLNQRTILYKINFTEGLYGNRIMVRTPKSELKPGEPDLKFLGEQPEFDHSQFVSGPVKKGK